MDLALTGLLVQTTACESDDTTSSTTPVVDDNGDSDVMPTSNTIVDVAVTNGRFTTLVGALQSTGLDEVLAGEGPLQSLRPPTQLLNYCLQDGSQA